MSKKKVTPWLSYEDIEEIISNIKYKEARIRLLRGGHTWDAEIEISWTAVDVDTGKPGPFHSRSGFDLRSFNSELDVLAYIRSLIRNMELHEADEWFTYKNRRIFDPHKNNNAAQHSQ